MFENPCGCLASLPLASFDTWPQGIPPTLGGGSANNRGDLEERPLPLAQLQNNSRHAVRKHHDKNCSKCEEQTRHDNRRHTLLYGNCRPQI